MKNIFPVRILLLITTICLVACDDYDFPVSVYAKILTKQTENISQTGARFVGDLVKLDSKSITQHGFVWGFNENVSIKSFDTLILGSLSETGVFKADVTDLDPGTTYFVRSFVYTGEYYIYGDAVSFKTK